MEWMTIRLLMRLRFLTCDKKEGDDSDNGDLYIYELRQWLDLIYGDHTKVDIKVKEGVGDGEVELTDEEFSNPDNENLIDKDEVAEIFRIETDIFDFETDDIK
ncbi:hypothetical protein Tco_0025574 [Tanacetum coccineum]